MKPIVDLDEAITERIARGLRSLTDRQREVLSLTLAGLTAPEVAQRLGISDRTVEVHMRHVRHRLGVNSALLIGIHIAAMEARAALLHSEDVWFVDRLPASRILDSHGEKTES